MLLSEIRTKKVVSVSDARILGTVDGVYINRDTYKAEYISLSGDIRIYPVDGIYAHKDILTVVNMQDFTPDEDLLNDMIKYDNGIAVYDVKGNYLATSADIEISKKRKVTYFTTDAKPIKLKYVVAANKDIILINPSLRPLLTDNRNRDTLFGEIKALPENKVEAERELPIRADHASDYSFLLGRRLNHEVSDISRSFVLMAGTLITERVIANARKAGKISDLVTKSS